VPLTTKTSCYYSSRLPALLHGYAQDRASDSPAIRHVTSSKPRKFKISFSMDEPLYSTAPHAHLSPAVYIPVSSMIQLLIFLDIFSATRILIEMFSDQALAIICSGHRST
jgi:hypothetical protein